MRPLPSESSGSGGTSPSGTSMSGIFVNRLLNNCVNIRNTCLCRRTRHPYDQPCRLCPAREVHIYSYAGSSMSDPRKTKWVGDRFPLILADSHCDRCWAILHSVALFDYRSLQPTVMHDAWRLNYHWPLPNLGIGENQSPLAPRTGALRGSSSKFCTNSLLNGGKLVT